MQNPNQVFPCTQPPQTNTVFPHDTPPVTDIGVTDPNTDPNDMFDYNTLASLEALAPNVPSEDPEPATDLTDEKEAIKAVTLLVADLFKILTPSCPTPSLFDRITVHVEGKSTKVSYSRRPNDHYQLEIGYKALTQPRNVLAARIVHEFVHIYNDSIYVKDTSRSGMYHTEEFKNVAESYGLLSEWGKGRGFAPITPQLDASRFTIPPSPILPEDSPLASAQRPLNVQACPHCGKPIVIKNHKVMPLTHKDGLPN
jgi:hypothetical protein